MTKYDKFSPRSHQAPRPWDIHPVWRGIGCFMILLIPVMAYAGAVLLVQENVNKGWLPTPPELAQTVQLPGIGPVAYLYANLLVTLFLSLVGFGFLVAIYSLMYAFIGPPRYGPLDSPPLERRPRKRR